MLHPLTAEYALTLPYPQSLFGKAEPVKLSLSAQFNIAFFTSSHVAAGFFCKYNAQIPATIGDDIDVPLLRFFPAATFAGSVADKILSSDCVPAESTHSPVAVMSGLIRPSRVGPRLENEESSPTTRLVSLVIAKFAFV